MREKHCGHAITLKQKGTKRSRDIFQTGIAAHAVLEDIGKAIKKNPDISLQDIKQIANDTAAILCSKGRAYDNIPEPPMKISQALEGMKLALKHIYANELDPEAEYEMPLAFNDKWEQVPYYDKTAVFRTLIDYLHIYKEIDEDGEESTIAIVKDYKTSWHITNDMLDNLQRRAQALVVYLAYPEIDVLVMQVQGLRNNKTIQRRIYTQPEYDTLQEWQNDISLAIKALLEPQIPNPGINCYNCPYANACQWTEEINPGDIVQKYAAFLTIVKQLEKDVRILTKEISATTPQGTVGYSQKERLTTQENALLTLWNVWKQQNGSVEDFLVHIKLNATNAKKLIRVLSQNGIDYDSLANQTITKQQYSQFGISKANTTVQTKDDNTKTTVQKST